MTIDEHVTANQLRREVFPWCGVCDTCGRPADADHENRVIGPVESWTDEHAFAAAEDACDMALRNHRFHDTAIYTAEFLRDQVAVAGARLKHYHQARAGVAEAPPSPPPAPAEGRAARNYPLARPADGEDRRFTFGLILDISQVLERHGFPPVSGGDDYVALMLALFAFIYEAGASS